MSRRAGRSRKRTSGSNGRATRELCISSGASGSRGDVARSSTTTAAPSRAATSRRRRARSRRGTQHSATKARDVEASRSSPSSRSSSPAIAARRPRSRVACGARSASRSRRVASMAPRKLGHPALHRLDGRPEREALERPGQLGAAHLRTAQQGTDRLLVLVGKHDQAADRAVVHARPRHVDAAGELLGQLVAEHLDDLLVFGVEHESDRAQAQTPELLIIEIGELGDERQEQPERLQVAREDQALVAKRVQPAAQGRDLGPQALQLGARRSGVERALGSQVRASRRVGARRATRRSGPPRAAARRGEPHVPPRRPAPRLRPRTARRRSPRGRVGEAHRPCDRRRSGGR